MILVPALHKGMLRRPDDPHGIYFQLRMERPVPVAQNIADPRPPIFQQTAVFMLADKRNRVVTILQTVTERAVRREAFFCRVDEATFADVVFDRADCGCQKKSVLEASTMREAIQ